MHRSFIITVVLVMTGMVVGCRTSAPDEESGPGHTVAYYISVESSVPNVTIQTNQVVAGKTPLILKVLGDEPGSFHNFGSPEFVVQALPPSTNEFSQTKTFRSGKGTIPGDRIPGVIFFDMSQRSGGIMIDSIPSR
jgi:hypothetical protein